MCHGAVLSAASDTVYHERMNRVLHMPELPVVKVNIGKDLPSLFVEVKGSHNIYDPYAGKKLEAAFTGSSYQMVPTKEGITWGQHFPGVYQIAIISDKVTAPLIVNGIPYDGVVAFYQTGDKLTAVNWINLDEFTASILNSIFLPKDADNKEVIAAYAIAIRSKVYQQMLRNEKNLWDLQGGACGYNGRSTIRNDLPFVEAMKATKRLVMTSCQQRQETFDTQAIEKIRQQMPLSEVQKMAQQGKDASEILHHFYPEYVLNVIEISSK
jgi:hypothetical protein